MTTFNDLKTKLKNLTRKWYYLKEETDEMMEDMKQTLNSSLNSMYSFMYDTFESKSNKTTSWTSPTDTKYPSAKLVKDSLDDKISKSSTTGLVKNDGTIDTTTYSTFSGSYNDLSNKPSIPSSSSDLSDGSSLIKTSNTTGLVKNDGSIDTNSYSTTSHNHSSLTPIAIDEVNADLDDYIYNGYYYHDDSMNTVYNVPVSPLSVFKLIVISETELGNMPLPNLNYKYYQILIDEESSDIYLRDGVDGSKSINWSYWKKFYHTGNFPIIDNLTTNDGTKVLSSKQGYLLNTNKADKSNGASQITDSSASGYTNISSSLSSSSTQANINSAINTALNGKANSSHNHTASNITDMTTVQVVVTYTDNTTENLVLYKQVTQNQS